MFITITVVMTNFCSYKVPSESIKTFGFFIYSKTKRRKKFEHKNCPRKVSYILRFQIPYK